MDIAYTYIPTYPCIIKNSNTPLPSRASSQLIRFASEAISERARANESPLTRSTNSFGRIHERRFEKKKKKERWTLGGREGRENVKSVRPRKQTNEPLDSLDGQVTKDGREGSIDRS